MSNIENKKLKRKMDEVQPMDVADPKPSQALRLGSNSMVGESSSKSFKSIKTSMDFDSSLKSSGPSNDKECKENPSLDHSCPYCDKKFSSPQALGGHQNAHKHERLLNKEKDKYMYDDELGARYSRHAYSYMRNYYQGSPSNLYHGVQFQRPMAQMPSMSCPRLSSVAYGHYQGLHLPRTSFTRQRFGSSSSWSVGGAVPPRFNLQGLRLSDPINQIPPPVNNEANQSQAHAGVVNPLEDPSVSPAAPQVSVEDPTVSPTPQASEELDLTLKLSFP